MRRQVLKCCLLCIVLLNGPCSKAQEASQGSSLDGNDSSSSSSYFSKVLGMDLPQPWDTIGMTQVVRDNLEPDILFWQQQQQPLCASALFEEAKTNHNIRDYSSTSRLMRIQSNELTFLGLPEDQPVHECDDRCDPQMRGFVTAFQTAVTQLNMTFPDVIFILNTNDAHACPKHHSSAGAVTSCKAPVISISKDAGHADIVAPVLRMEDADVSSRSLPWADKKDKAFFRGVPSCGEMPFPPKCARSWVARLAHNHSDVLDAGIIQSYGSPAEVDFDPVLRDGQGPLPVLPAVGMEVLPEYKWLLSLDGHTAAYRLSHLLAVNSLVLKQESRQWEFYYRSLRPFQHYVPILIDSQHDLLPAVEWVRKNEHDKVQRIIARANAFAMRHTTYEARMLYWKYVLLAYKHLMPDMDDCLTTLTAEGKARRAAPGADESANSAGPRVNVAVPLAAAGADMVVGSQQQQQQQQQQQAEVADDLAEFHKAWQQQRRQWQRSRAGRSRQQPAARLHHRHHSSQETPAPGQHSVEQQQQHQLSPAPDQREGPSGEQQQQQPLDELAQLHSEWQQHRQSVATNRQQRRHKRRQPGELETG